ncbi:MAG TPA: MFS transporter [Aestuariivirgaceae bacterium]|jgi:MFS family permease
MSRVAAQPFRSRRGNLVAAIATIAVCDIAFGLTFPLLSLLLEQRGVPAWIIGLNSAMSPLGIIIAGPFIPAAVRIVGARRLGHLTIFGMAGLLISFYLFPSLPAWFALRFAFGVIAGTLYTLSEAWIVHFAEGPKRGRITGLYTSVVSITFAAGPLIIPYFDVRSITPWLIGTAMVLIAAFPLMFVRLQEGEFQPEASHSVARFVRRAPLLLFAVLTMTVFDAVMLAFFIIYGLRNGLELNTASWTLGVSIAGNAVLQYPIGILADRWRRTTIMWLAGATTMLMAGMLPLAVHSFLIWPVAFIMGTAAYAIYTAALAILGDEFKGAELIAGAAAFAAIWGVGGITGPPIVGAAVDAFGIHALPAFLVALYAALLILLFASGGRLVRRAR